jgi:hypothetical protein
MARSKSYPEIPVVVTFLSSSKAKKPKKKIFRNKNIDEVIEGLEKGNLDGISALAEIQHIGIGSRFI